MKGILEVHVKPTWRDMSAEVVGHEGLPVIAERSEVAVIRALLNAGLVEVTEVREGGFPVFVYKFKSPIAEDLYAALEFYQENNNLGNNIKAEMYYKAKAALAKARGEGEEADTSYPFSYICQGCEHEWSIDVENEDECPKCQSINRVVKK